MLKTIKHIEPVTIGREDAGRYEYQDVKGTTECGDVAFKVTAETTSDGNVDIYFKSRENAEAFINEK